MKTLTNSNFLKLSTNASSLRISQSAPRWALDGFKEMVEKEKMAPSEAIKKLKTSPFFDDSWVV